MNKLWKIIIVVTVLFIFLQLRILVYSYSTARKITFQHAAEGPQMTLQLFDLLEQRKDSKDSITITFTNIGNVLMTQNFMVELEKVGVKNWVVVSFDSESCKILGKYCYHDPSKNFNLDKVVWGSPEYFEMINYRAYLWLLLLRHGYHAFCVDTDIFLRDNPYLYFDNSYDLNIMREYPSMGTPIWQTMRQLGLCCNGDERYLNAGFFFLRSTPASIRVVEEMQKIMKEDKSIPDQDAFNIALLRVPTATVRVLDKELFPNGFVAFLQATPAQRNIIPVVQHANWVRDHDAKIYRARELLSWHMDKTERYAAERKYLSYYTADDVVTFDMERDYLQLAYTELGYYENSLLHNPAVPPNNLQSFKVYLPAAEDGQGPGTLKQLLKKFEARNDNLIEMVFPKMSAHDGTHVSLISLPDRYDSATWKEYAEEIERKVRFNDELLFAPWYTYWKNDLEKVSYSCLVTDSHRLDYAIKNLKRLSPDNTLYVVSNNPGMPTPEKLYSIKDHWSPWVVWGFDFMWPGHKMMKGHNAIIQLQMEACAAAQHVVINIWQPTWLIEGICAMRKETRGETKSDCVRLVRLQL